MKESFFGGSLLLEGESKAAILNRTMVMEGQSHRIATKPAACRDLVRVGRNANMADQEEFAADD